MYKKIGGVLVCGLVVYGLFKFLGQERFEAVIFPDAPRPQDMPQEDGPAGSIPVTGQEQGSETEAAAAAT